MAKPKFEWKNRFPSRGVKAETAYGAIDRLRKDRGGSVAPADVVEAARPRNHVLHALFTWDDTVAAAKFREAQAATLMRSIVIYSGEENADPVRAIACVSMGADDSEEGEDDAGKRWLPMMDALADPGMSSQVVEQARRELEGWKQRYRTYRELAAALVRVEEAIAAAK